METEHLIPVVEAEKSLGIITASIFLAGEMAGSGVLALSSAVVHTGQIVLEIYVYLQQMFYDF